MKQLFLFLLLISTLPSMAQQSISLEECYNLVLQNYPLAKQSQLLETQNNLEAEVISNAKLPQFSLDAQATYQSDVIEVPIPNANIEPINKDQYRATFTVNQLIYNGGLTSASLAVKAAQLKTSQKQIEVSIYQLKQQINQLYFSILLAQESKLLLDAKQALLEAKLKEVRSGIKYGTLLPSSDKVLEVALLKIDQQFQALKSHKKTLVETLSSIISQPLDAATQFKNPLIAQPVQTTLNRPELELFQFKKAEIEHYETLLSKQNAPKVFGFATGGYGNPGLNMLDNSFQSFYTVGVKLHWNIFDWNTNKKERESIIINKALVDNQAEVFTLNTLIDLNKQQREMEKMEAFLKSDIAIIKLRKEVLQTADSQLKNGVISSSAYVTELTNLYAEENNLVQHKIQLQLAKVNYNVIQGL